MRSLNEIIGSNQEAENEARARRIALIKSELKKLDNVAVQEVLSSLADKE